MDISDNPIKASELVSYQDGSIVSKILLKTQSGNVTAFAFDHGQELSEHTAPYDALVQILDGQAEIRIGDQDVQARQGELVLLPANIPHALKAQERFKMLLTMIKSQ